MLFYFKNYYHQKSHNACKRNLFTMYTKIMITYDT